MILQYMPIEVVARLEGHNFAPDPAAFEPGERVLGKVLLDLLRGEEPRPAHLAGREDPVTVEELGRVVHETGYGGRGPVGTGIDEDGEEAGVFAKGRRGIEFGGYFFFDLFFVDGHGIPLAIGLGRRSRPLIFGGWGLRSRMYTRSWHHGRKRFRL
jgi:hypothetical protein